MLSPRRRDPSKEPQPNPNVNNYFTPLGVTVSRTVRPTTTPSGGNYLQVFQGGTPWGLYLSLAIPTIREQYLKVFRQY